MLGAEAGEDRLRHSVYVDNLGAVGLDQSFFMATLDSAQGKFNDSGLLIHKVEHMDDAGT